MLTADHGHTDISGEEIINLNRYDLIEESLLVSSNGKRILPTGSPHDIFLHIKKNRIKDLLKFLEKELVGMADVVLTGDAMQKGLFGLNQPSNVFKRRIGDILILPYDNYHIWYDFLPGQPYSQKGVHGGLSESEMVVPLAISRLDQII